MRYTNLLQNRRDVLLLSPGEIDPLEECWWKAPNARAAPNSTAINTTTTATAATAATATAAADTTNHAVTPMNERTKKQFEGGHLEVGGKIFQK